MAIKIQGHIFAKGKSFWRSGGSVPVIVTPTTATYSVRTSQATINKGQPLTFIVSRNKDDGAQTASYTLGGTAVAGTDYTAPSTTVSFLMGETEKTIIIETNADSTSTTDRTITFMLTTITGTGTASASPATGTISATATQPGGGTPGGGDTGGGTPGGNPGGTPGGNPGGTPGGGTDDQNAIALEDGSGVFYSENDGGYLAREEGTAGSGTGTGGTGTGGTGTGGTTPTPTPTAPDDQISAQDGSAILAQNGTDYIAQ